MAEARGEVVEVVVPWRDGNAMSAFAVSWSGAWEGARGRNVQL